MLIFIHHTSANQEDKHTYNLREKYSEIITKFSTRVYGRKIERLCKRIVFVYANTICILGWQKCKAFKYYTLCKNINHAIFWVDRRRYKHSKHIQTHSLWWLKSLISKLQNFTPTLRTMLPLTRNSHKDFKTIFT